MLFLLESPIEVVDLFLEPLRRYIASSVKIENQIKGRKAIWLIEVNHYLQVKLEFEQRIDSLVESKIVEVKNNDIITHTSYIK